MWQGWKKLIPIAFNSILQLICQTFNLDITLYYRIGNRHMALSMHGDNHHLEIVLIVRHYPCVTRIWRWYIDSNTTRISLPITLTSKSEYYNDRRQHYCSRKMQGGGIVPGLDVRRYVDNNMFSRSFVVPVCLAEWYLVYSSQGAWTNMG